ncbi:MAG: helix-turn-helix domain-containing protein [Pseudonocardia sp.]
MPPQPRGHQFGGDELSQTLRQLREAAHLSGVEAGKRAGFSQAKISRLEGGINVPTPEDVKTLAEVYQASPAVRARLIQLAEDMRASLKRVVLNRGGSEFQARLARIEEASEHVRTFAPTVVPGLLQTEAYARAVFSSGTLTPEQIDTAVAGRIQRQRLLSQQTHQFTLLTTAGALGWCAGSLEVMTEQAERLAGPQPPTVRVGIVRWGTPATVFPLHTWDMYDQRAVSVGLVHSTALLTAPQDVAEYEKMFTALELMAVFGDEARRAFRQIANEYRNPPAHL